MSKFTMLHPTQDEDDPLFDQYITVEFGYYGGCKGARDSFNGRPGAGIQLEPDDEPEMEIERITDEDGAEIGLTDDEEEKASDYFWEKLDEILGRDE